MPAPTAVEEASGDLLKEGLLLMRLMLLLPSPDATLLPLLTACARGIEVPVPTAVEEASGDLLKGADAAADADAAALTRRHAAAATRCAREGD